MSAVVKASCFTAFFTLVVLSSCLQGVSCASSSKSKSLRKGGAAAAAVEVGTALQKALTEEYGSDIAAFSAENLGGFEASFEKLSATLPKGSDGLLEHAAAAYALHRILVQRHGWYINGLEPGSHPAAVSANGLRVFGETLDELLPADAQSVLEQHAALGQGVSSRELALLAATLEHAASQEIRGRLEEIFRLYNVSQSGVVKRSEADDVIDTFVINHLSSGLFRPTTAKEGQRKVHLFRSKFKTWPSLSVWISQLRSNVTANIGEADQEQAGSLDFSAALQIADAFGKQYAFFDESECRNLKEALLSVESDRPGRVRLADFYRKAMNSDGVFKFTEKVEYLRALGALDESDASNPAVIVPNYVTSSPQCLNASALYSVCCRNECEALMEAIEEQAQASEVLPKKVLDIVTNLKSSTVEAPRSLSIRLFELIDRVAAANDGVVPLHGRLFTQWMHHAFPRECPFPHEDEGVERRRMKGPALWMQETGHGSHEASEEEMVCHVSGPCAGALDSTNSSEELPWSDTEKLLSERRPAARSVFRAISQAGMLIGMLVAAGRAASSSYRAAAGEHVIDPKKSLLPGAVF